MSKELFYRGQPGTSDAVAIAAAATARTIDAATVHNPTGGAVTITIYIRPAATAAAAANAVYTTFSVAAGATVTLPGLINHCIKAGEVLSLLASSATSLTVFISGRVQ